MPKRYHSAVRFTDYKSFNNLTPSSELLGYYQPSALRTATYLLCKADGKYWYKHTHRGGVEHAELTQTD